MTDAIRKSLDVPLSPRAAFDLFTRGMDRWWPMESHSLSGSARASVRVEPREGGQIIETRPDGTEAPWARITAWDPPRRIAVLWHVGRTEAEATELEIVFHPQDTGTRVELTHGGFDRLAEGAALSDNYRSGWDNVFVARYGQACATAA